MASSGEELSSIVEFPDFKWGLLMGNTWRCSVQ